MQKVVKKEIVKLLDTGIIYPIADSPWVSPIHYVPKKGGTTVVTNKNNELVPTRTVTGWRVCIDYRKLNEATAKDHFPLPFMDQCWKDSQEINISVSSMLFLDIFKFLLILMIKKKQHSHVPSVHTLIGECLSDYVMLQLHFKEFDIEIKDKKGTKNVAAGHLSRIDNNESSDDSEVDDNFPGETLMEINTRNEPWFADFANYLVGYIIPKGMTYQQKNKFFSDLKHYFWEEPYLFKVCSDGMIRRSISGPETRTILDQCHHGPTGGHYGPNVTAKKVLDSGFYWPTIIKEAHTLVRLCEACQKTGNISKHDETPLNNIQIMENTMKRYGVNQRFSTSYHPQTSGQVENTNRALKRILEKTVKDNPAIWSRKLDDALWAFHTAYKTLTGTTPYKLIYGKNYHLPLKIEHRAYWALKNCNPDLIATREKRMFQLHELDELRHQAYENSRLYKARTKVWHDRKLRMRKEFKHGNKVLLFHSKYKFKQLKLRSRWLGPYVVKHQYLSGYVELYGKDGKTFIVNGHRLKLYHEEEDYNHQREAITLFFPKE
ncbi:reverse transcriptase domain-containing protein [Tanacetum coccineum]